MAASRGRNCNLDTDLTLTCRQIHVRFCATAFMYSSNNSLAALQKDNVSCALDGSFHLGGLPADPTTIIETIDNQSGSKTVLHVTGSTLSYLGPPAEHVNSTLDFVASSYAVEILCQPISRACNLVVGVNITFDCNDGAFVCDDDTLDVVGFAAQVFKVADMSDKEDPGQIYGVHNPFYVVVATENNTPSRLPLRKDAQLEPTVNGVTGVFSCGVAIYDLVYAWSQGEARKLSATLSNTSVTNMFASGVTSQPSKRDKMVTDLDLAAILSENAQDLADGLVNTLSNAVLSGGAGSVQVAPAHVAQQMR